MSFSGLMPSQLRTCKSHQSSNSKYAFCHHFFSGMVLCRAALVTAMDISYCFKHVVLKFSMIWNFHFHKAFYQALLHNSYQCQPFFHWQAITSECKAAIFFHSITTWISLCEIFSMMKLLSGHNQVLTVLVIWSQTAFSEDTCHAETDLEVCTSLNRQNTDMIIGIFSSQQNLPSNLIEIRFYSNFDLVS